MGNDKHMNAFDFRTNMKLAHFAATAMLAPMWIWFAYRHVHAYLETGTWSYLFLCVSETLTVAFLLVRSYPKSVSAVRSDWLIAIIGSFSTLCMAPSDWGLLPEARHAVAVGTFMQVLGMLSLNRSFGLVAATRQIKTGGLYRYIRHPLYASYLVTFTGYLLANTSRENVAVYVFAMGCMIVRIFREEHHLALELAYREYMDRVRYRLIPFVF